jgi:hypothetical protein
MPMPKSQLDRMITRLDEALSTMGKPGRNTDPKEFLESPSTRRPPIAEPPDTPQEDSATKRRDLFK